MITDRDLVDRGIALLNERGPEGWRGRVNLERLNLRDYKECLLAQLYGTFADGVKQLDIDPQVYGFVHQGIVENCYCARLTEAWRQALTEENRSEDGPSDPGAGESVAGRG